MPQIPYYKGLWHFPQITDFGDAMLPDLNGFKTHKPPVKPVACINFLLST